MTTETIPARVDTHYRGGMSATDQVDVRGLRQALEQAVEGEVRFDTASKAMYATDASNYRQVPLGVVIPETLEDIVATHRACHRFGAPVLPRGGGTSLSGETVNFAVVIDVSKYLNEIGDPDAAAQTVICQPGVINEKLNEKTGEQIGMIFGPDPSTHSRCTIGGNIGNNSCGIHSV
jgi:FAD/FMN-containing dehydrogenase